MKIVKTCCCTLAVALCVAAWAVTSLEAVDAPNKPLQRLLRAHLPRRDSHSNGHPNRTERAVTTALESAR